MAVSLTEKGGSLASADGTELQWRAWECAKPKAVFAVVHGLGEHSGRYADFAHGMASHAMSTYAVDLRGMGGSSGRRGHLDRWSLWLEDAAALYRLVEERSDLEPIPLGHSFGGVVVLSAVIRGAIRPRRFVVSNPALKAARAAPGWKVALGRAASLLAPTLTLGNEVDPKLVSRKPEVVQAYADDPLVHDRISARLYSEWMKATEEVNRRAAEIKIPFLIILSDGDRIIDPDATRELDRRATGARHQLSTYPERYHEPFNDEGSHEVFDDLAAWVARPLT